MNELLRKERLLYLVRQCLAGIETLEEREELFSCLKEEKYKSLVGDVLLDAFYQEKELTDMSSEQQDMLFESIIGLERSEETAAKKQRGLLWLTWGAVAATVLLVLSPLWLSIGDKSIREQFVTAQEEAVDTVARGGIVRTPQTTWNTNEQEQADRKSVV